MNDTPGGTTPMMIMMTVYAQLINNIASLAEEVIEAILLEDTARDTIRNAYYPYAKIDWDLVVEAEEQGYRENNLDLDVLPDNFFNE